MLWNGCSQSMQHKQVFYRFWFYSCVLKILTKWNLSIDSQGSDVLRGGVPRVGQAKTTCCVLLFNVSRLTSYYNRDFPPG